MSSIQYSIVDAFSSKPFAGNPAAVVLIDHGDDSQALSDELMLKIAAEMNLSETAFITTTSSPDTFGLRWFTPTAEVALCGHATIASTAFLSNHPKYSSLPAYNFNTLSGLLVCKKKALEDGGESFELDFPEDVPTDQIDAGLLATKHTALKAALGGNYERVKRIWKGKFDTVVEVEVPAGDHLGDWKVDINAIAMIDARGVCLTTVLPTPSTTTAPSFHSRFFAPLVGVNEDPVCGSLHCTLAPLYTKKLNLAPGTEIFATHGGPRRGEISVVWDAERKRVILRGKAVIMASGTMRTA